METKQETRSFETNGNDDACHGQCLSNNHKCVIDRNTRNPYCQCLEVMPDFSYRRINNSSRAMKTMRVRVKINTTASVLLTTLEISGGAMETLAQAALNLFN